MQDVPAALRRRGLAVACFEDPSRRAVLAADHAVRVNHDTFLFADTAARERFLAHLIERCGPLTDPVTRRRFAPDADSPRLSRGDVEYVFEGPPSLRRFLRDPERYALPRVTM